LAETCEILRINPTLRLWKEFFLSLNGKTRKKNKTKQKNKTKTKQNKTATTTTTTTKKQQTKIALPYVRCYYISARTYACHMRLQCGSKITSLPSKS